jgi:Fe-S cluster biosynthesis and repair protein YggX
MGTAIEIIDNINNTGTLYEEVLSEMYSGDELNTMLINTKFLRVNILKAIKDFVDHEKTIFVKEFSDSPIMAYADSERFDYGMPELYTDLAIVREAFTLSKINEHSQIVDSKYPLVLEALNYDDISKESWNDFLDQIHLLYNGEETLEDDRVHKIIVEDVISKLKKWSNVSDAIQKEMIKEYNTIYGIEGYNTATFFQEPLDIISKTYWEKFSFVLTINDYEIYDPANAEWLNIIAEKYFNNGYFDEVVIKMNYFYWHDDFQKIVDWSEQNLRSALVSYRFDTIFKHTEKNRYYDESEAAKYGDSQRQNTMLEEMEMFETRIPVLLEKILTNPQTYGFELNDGYFGMEGNVPGLSLDSDEFNEYKEIVCKIMSITPFAEDDDSFMKVFREPEKKVFICMKKTDNTTSGIITNQ